MLRKIAGISLKVLLGLIVVILIVPALLYVPFVQDFVVRIASEKASEASGMDISVGKLRLGFPLKLNVEDISIVQANADTMLTAGGVSASVRLMPLLKGTVDVDGISVRDAFYQMGNSDSIMWLRARIENGRIDDVDLALKQNQIVLGRSEIYGADVWMRMLPDTAAVKPDTTASAPWVIDASFIKLARVNYSMVMQPTIDSLGCYVGEAVLRNARIDMPHNRIKGQSLRIDSVSASYLYPRIAQPAPADSADAAAPSSTPWTITADTLRLTGGNALYAVSGASPQKGLDMSYIKVSDVEIAVDSFYNRGTSIRVPLRKLSAAERSGLKLFADGVFAMDERSMRAENFSIETLRSLLRFSASMGMGDMMTSTDIPISLKATGRIDPADISMAFPDMAAMLAPMRPASLTADIDGTSGQLDVYDLSIYMPTVMKMRMEGAVEYPFNPEKIGGGLSVTGNIATLTDRQFSFLPIKKLPALGISGDVNYHPGYADGGIDITAGGGRLAASGSWTARKEDYDADITVDRFPVQLFMPELGVGAVSGRITVDGRGYNPMAKGTAVDANIKVNSVEYMKTTYKDIALNASLHAGEATGTLTSHNPGADAVVDFNAFLTGDTVRYALDGKLNDINLLTLHLSDSVNNGHLSLRSEGFYNVMSQGMDVTATIDGLYWKLPGLTINPSAPVSLAVKSENTVSRINLTNGDLKADFSSPMSVFDFAAGIPPAMQLLTAQMDSMRVDVVKLSNTLPRFTLLAEMGENNLAGDILKGSGMSMKHLLASVGNDTLLNMHAAANGLAVGTTKIDSLSVNAVQHNDYLIYKAEMDNRPGTFDDFAHVTANGYVGFNRASVFINQKNIKDENGFKIGLNASIDSSVVTARLVPYTPVIAYKKWSLNKDNFLSYNIDTKHLDADIDLSGNNSFLKIFTSHPDDGADGEQEDLMVEVSRIKLQDWLSINPFAPPVKGDLSANLRFRYEEPVLTGNGTVSLSDLYYGKDRVGDFDLDLNVANSPGGKLMADVSLMVDSVKTITATGVLNDSTLASPFLLDFKMVHFPLRVANPFIPQQMASLKGMLNGTMKITGDMANPIFDGYLNFDTASVNVKMLGTSFEFSQNEIPVDSNVISFKDYTIRGCNENPLAINGVVDARHISDIRFDLALQANRIQVVNSNRARKGADIYGKAFLDIDATAKGNMSFMNINADLSVLENTNVTYVMSDAQEVLAQKQNDDMVQFVNFADTAQVLSADSIKAAPMSLNLLADLHIMQGAVINVDLSGGSNNKIQIQPSGDLDFSMSPLNGQRLTGRLNINNGFARYSPPLMGEKNFKFQEGSYVAFNGDMMNPVLNVQAVDVLRANVTQSGQNSRLVDFDIQLSVTGTLEDMNVAFDLSTNDDITVQNELTAMSPEQRANQAMNLLLYNKYMGAGTKGNASLGGNPVFSFLTSQINNWAANNVRGVDISFGIDQYDRTYEGSTSTTTSYSYRVSKSLFNDRFKIVVGGNYSTDADADENFSQNLINDISFQYMLNNSGSMYVSIFRHTGYESILEGEITQTGVGFVLKRKLNSLWELIGIKRD